MEITASKTIVFITELFINSTCWDEWITFFEGKGYTCIAPPHPHKNATTQVLRSRHPNQKVASIGLKRLVQHFAEIIKKLPEQPILIGHGIGGLVVQLLLQQNIGSAGIAIHPAPPKGIVSLSISSLKATWGPFGLFTPKKSTFLMSLEQWQHAFTNNMPLQEQRKSYYQFVVPESKKIFRDALTNVAKVDFSKSRGPLLLMAGGKDNISPASIARKSFKRYGKSNSITAYKEFKNRNHFVINGPGWQEYANYILQWLSEIF